MGIIRDSVAASDFKGPWQANESYESGNVSTLNNDVYIYEGVSGVTASPASSGDWKQINNVTVGANGGLLSVQTSGSVEGDGTSAHPVRLTQAFINTVNLNTAKIGITQNQANAIAANTLKNSITDDQASAITANTAKDGITQDQSDAIIANTAKVTITSDQITDIANNKLKVGITQDQANEITANTAKNSITAQQTAEIVANTLKVGITQLQASEITANTAKRGITQTQSNAITANTAKTGISNQQTTDITANTAARHTHTNKTDLDGLTIVSGELNINGVPITSSGNPLVSVSRANNVITFTSQDGTTTDITIPTSGSGGGTITPQTATEIRDLLNGLVGVNRLSVNALKDVPAWLTGTDLIPDSKIPGSIARDSEVNALVLVETNRAETAETALGVRIDDIPAGATGPAGADGAAGSPGAAGADGAQGNPGPAGSDGNPGADGAAGADGAQGSQGNPGVAGNDGATGPAGNDGPAGAQGIQGNPGIQGIPGSGGGGTIVPYTQTDHYLHLGAHNLRAAQNGLVSGAGTVTANNTPYTLRFDSAGTIPTGGSNDETTGNIILPAGFWIVCASINTTISGTSSNTNRAQATLSIYDGANERHAQSIYLKNANFNSATYQNLQGKATVAGAVISNGTTPITIKLEKFNQDSGATMSVAGAHIHCFEQIEGNNFATGLTDVQLAEIVGTDEFIMIRPGGSLLVAENLTHTGTNYGYAQIGSRQSNDNERAGGTLENAPDSSLAAIFYNSTQRRWNIRVNAPTALLATIDINGTELQLTQSSNDSPVGTGSWGSFFNNDIYSSAITTALPANKTVRIKVKYADGTYYIGAADTNVKNSVDTVLALHNSYADSVAATAETNAEATAVAADLVVSQSVTAEVTRATTAESAEVTRAEGAETALGVRINNIPTLGSAVIGTSTASPTSGHDSGIDIPAGTTTGHIFFVFSSGNHSFYIDYANLQAYTGGTSGYATTSNYQELYTFTNYKVFGALSGRRLFLIFEQQSPRSVRPFSGHLVAYSDTTRPAANAAPYVRRKSWFVTRGMIDPTRFYNITDTGLSNYFQLAQFRGLHLIQLHQLQFQGTSIVPTFTNLETNSDADDFVNTNTFVNLPLASYPDNGAGRYFSLDGTFTIEAYLDLEITNLRVGVQMRLRKVMAGVDDAIITRGRSGAYSTSLGIGETLNTDGLSGVSMKSHVPIVFRPQDKYYIEWKGNNTITNGAGMSFSMSIYEE